MRIASRQKVEDWNQRFSIEKLEEPTPPKAVLEEAGPRRIQFVPAENLEENQPGTLRLPVFKVDGCLVISNHFQKVKIW